MIFDHTNIPSKTLPYPVKQIEVVPFKPKQLALMSKAVMLDNFAPAVEAMGQSMTNLDVNDLTVGDFFFLLTWQRLNSLKRNPVMAKWTCPGTIFNDRANGTKYFPRDIKVLVDNWEAADDEVRKTLIDPNDVMLDGYVCSHANYEPITMEDFRVLYLDDDIVLDQRLDYPRAETLAEFVDLQRNPDYGMLAEAGQWVRGKGSLLKRVQAMVDAEDTDLLEAACEANRDYRHGILRTITKPCTICGHNHEMTMVVDPKSFFL